MLIQAEDRESWLAERRRFLGASEVAALFGLSPWKSVYALWCEKSGLVIPDDAETEAQHWGIVLEGPIADEYTRQTGRALTDHGRWTIRASETCHGLSCTLDREILPIDDRGPGALEIKTTHAFNAADWTDGAPLIYQTQIQAQLEVTGWKWGSAAVLVGGQSFHWCDVERNEKFIAAMRAKVREFWQMVETKTPPPVDGSEATANALKALYPKDTGETVALTGEAVHWDTDLANAELAIAQGEKAKKEARNKLIAAIGSATYGVLPNGVRYSLKTVTRGAHQVAESTYRPLKRVK